MSRGRVSVHRSRRRTCPPWRSFWGHISKQLLAMGVLTVADGLALEALCEDYADLQRYRKALADRGADTYELTAKSGAKMIRAYPEVAMAADADRRFQSWLGKFGLTPVDRARVSAAVPESGPSAWDRFR